MINKQFMYNNYSKSRGTWKHTGNVRSEINENIVIITEENINKCDNLTLLCTHSSCMECNSQSLQQLPNPSYGLFSLRYWDIQQFHFLRSINHRLCGCCHSRVPCILSVFQYSSLCKRSTVSICHLLCTHHLHLEINWISY